MKLKPYLYSHLLYTSHLAEQLTWHHWSLLIYIYLKMIDATSFFNNICPSILINLICVDIELHWFLLKILNIHTFCSLRKLYDLIYYLLSTQHRSIPLIIKLIRHRLIWLMHRELDLVKLFTFYQCDIDWFYYSFWIDAILSGIKYNFK